MITYLKFNELDGLPDAVLSGALNATITLTETGEDLFNVIQGNKIIGQLELYNNEYYFNRFGEEREVM